MNKVLLCHALLDDVTLFSLFNVFYSPDVKTFLLMDRQNFSDGSEDEDDKVSKQSSNFYKFWWVS